MHLLARGFCLVEWETHQDQENPKLENKYLGPFEILEAVRKQAYKLKFPAKWRIYLVSHVLLLEKDFTRREAVDQKIADQLEFEEGEDPEQEVDSIIDSMVFAEEAMTNWVLLSYSLERRNTCRRHSGNGRRNYLFATATRKISCRNS